MIERQLTLGANGSVRLPGYDRVLRFGYARNAGMYQLKVQTQNEWKDLTIRAFWHLPGTDEPLTTLVQDGVLSVPALVTSQSGTGVVVFEGSDGTKNITSADLTYRVSANAGTDDPEMPEPGTPAWQQFIGLVQANVDASFQMMEQLREDIANGKFKGDPGTLSDSEKALFLTLFEHTAYDSPTMLSTYNQLKDLWQNSGGGSSSETVPVTSITLDQTNLILKPGGTTTLTATVLPVNATDRNVLWSINPTGYATVSGGKVTALKVGSCTITASAGGKSASCSVSIQEVIPIVYELTAPKTFVPEKSEFIDTGIKLFESITDEEWTLMLDVTNGSTATPGTDKYCIAHCMDETSPWPGLSIAIWGGSTGETGLNLYGFSQGLSRRANASVAFAERNTKVVICIKGGQHRTICPTASTTDTGWSAITNMKTTVNKTLILGAYQTSDGVKGRFYDGTINRCKVYKGICSDDTINAFLNA